MKERARDSVGFLHIATLAALSVVVLLGIGATRMYSAVAQGNSIVAENASAALSEYASTPYERTDWQAPSEIEFFSGQAPSDKADDKDGLSNIEGNVVRALLGSYTALSEAGVYTPEEGEKIAGEVASTLRANISYKTFAASDLKTDADVSYERMLAYRNDLRIALEPLLKNPGYEFKLFANYLESGDATYAAQLRETAKNYEVALEGAARIVIPEDALSYHLGILNALSSFGATVERMASHASDPFATAALLQTYNSSEAGLFTSFDSLATYYRSKSP